MVHYSSVLVALTATIAAFASPLRRRDPLANVISNCQNSGQVALTFDDGPYIYLSELVDTLDNNGVKATFFMNGQNYDNIYDRKADVQKAYNSGHQIASHTWSHAHLTTLSGDALNSEFSKVNDAFQSIFGKKAAFFRPPYGEYNAAVLQAAQNNGQQAVLWSFDSGDSTGSTPQQSEAAYTQIAKKYPAPLLALNHETYQSTVEQLIPAAIKTLKAAGYDFVTVADCVNASPYQ